MAMAMSPYEESFMRMASSMREVVFRADKDQATANINRAKGQYKRLGDLQHQLEQGHKIAFGASLGMTRTSSQPEAGGASATPPRSPEGGLPPLGGLAPLGGRLSSGGGLSVRSASSGSLASMPSTPQPRAMHRPPTPPVAAPRATSSIRSIASGSQRGITPQVPSGSPAASLLRSRSGGALLAGASGRAAAAADLDDAPNRLARPWRTQRNAFVQGY